MTNAPACPSCGAPAVWKGQANGWGCDRCQRMLPVAQAVAVPMPAMGPTCPRCGTMAVWQAQVGRWGCDRCRAYLDQMGSPQDAAKAAKRALAGRRIAVGLVLIIVGIAITAGTYSSASDRGGGTYFIAYGPIVVGAIRFFQGLGGLMV